MWSPFWKLFARVWLRIFRWKLVTGRPECRKFVMIAAPHTSNWDLPFMLAIAIAADVDLKFMIKHSAIKGPIGWFRLKMGAIPVVRHEKRNSVQQMADRFREADELALSVPPEGTRKRVEFWKSGFYRIAMEAQVPIVFGFLDFGKKQGGFGPAYMPTGDVKKDMDAIRAFYADKTGLYPKNFGPIVLESELDQAEAPRAAVS